MCNDLRLYSLYRKVSVLLILPSSVGIRSGYTFFSPVHFLLILHITISQPGFCVFIVITQVPITYQTCRSILHWSISENSKGPQGQNLSLSPNLHLCISLSPLLRLSLINFPGVIVRSFCLYALKNSQIISFTFFLNVQNRFALWISFPGWFPSIRN